MLVEPLAKGFDILDLDLHSGRGRVSAELFKQIRAAFKCLQQMKIADRSTAAMRDSRFRLKARSSADKAARRSLKRPAR